MLSTAQRVHGSGYRPLGPVAMHGLRTEVKADMWPVTCLLESRCMLPFARRVAGEYLRRTRLYGLVWVGFPNLVLRQLIGNLPSSQFGIIGRTGDEHVAALLFRGHFELGENDVMVHSNTAPYPFVAPRHSAVIILFHGLSQKSPDISLRAFGAYAHIVACSSAGADGLRTPVAAVC